MSPIIEAMKPSPNSDRQSCASLGELFPKNGTAFATESPTTFVSSRPTIFGSSRRPGIAGNTVSPERLSSWCGRLGASPYFAALAKSNGRIDDHQVALLDPVVYFHLRAQIARHRHLADTRRATLDHGDLHSVLIENRGIGGY